MLYKNTKTGLTWDVTDTDKEVLAHINGDENFIKVEPEKENVLTERNTVTEIRDYAAAHDIDLGAANTKAEMLAVINGAD